MPQLAERVHAIQRRTAAKERRPPIAEVQSSRSTGLARMRGAVSERVAHPVSEIVGGLPARLRAGVESLSGIAMDDVRVHRNSSEPAKLGALAFTRGTQIHLGPGQEEHLPHEAWHVVQQKQGRVQATTQMKGVAIADNAALEAEADMMAARATCVSPKRFPLRRSSAEGGAAQLKLIHQGIPLEDTPKTRQTYSAVTLKFIRRKETFLLRDDTKPDDKIIHVLHTGKKYLLGEQHYSRVWEEETKPWNVRKMTEGYAKVPKEADDVRGDFDGSWAHLDAEPLESAHPKILVDIIPALHDIETLLDRMGSDDESQPGKWKTWTASILEELKDIRIAYVDNYKPFLETFVRKFRPRLWDRRSKTFRPAPPRLAKIHTVSDTLRQAYAEGWTKGSQLLRLTRSVTYIESLMTSSKPAPKGWAKKVASQISRDASVLEEIAKDLISIISDGKPQEAQLLESLLPGSTVGTRPDVTAVMSPIRERYMAENIRNVAPPVLVQLGELHVDPVWRRLGASIEVAVPIHMDRKLSDVTSES